MIKMLNAVMVCTSLVGLVGVYALKYSVEDIASDKVALERKIDRQEGDLSLLKADWSYLNQPAHVAPIVAATRRRWLWCRRRRISSGAWTTCRCARPHPIPRRSTRCFPRSMRVSTRSNS